MPIFVKRAKKMNVSKTKSPLFKKKKKKNVRFAFYCNLFSENIVYVHIYQGPKNVMSIEQHVVWFCLFQIMPIAKYKGGWQSYNENKS